MGKGREIRSYDYVNHPYEAVRDVLARDAVAVFREATKGATARVEEVASELRVSIGGVEVVTDIDIKVSQVDERPARPTRGPVTRLQLEWQARNNPRLFPFMQAELWVYPLTGKETQLDFSGHYDPPMGPLGDAMDAIAGHRIAEASVKRFLADVALFLEKRLA